MELKVQMRLCFINISLERFIKACDDPLCTGSTGSITRDLHGRIGFLSHTLKQTLVLKLTSVCVFFPKAVFDWVCI